VFLLFLYIKKSILSFFSILTPSDEQQSTSLDTLVEEVNVVLPPRSLVIMTGEARYLWIHGIPYRAKDSINDQIVDRTRRVSLTIRKVEKKTVFCNFVR
jgi:hypothetical protein